MSTTTTATAATTNLTTPFTTAELEAVRNVLQTCWRVFTGGNSRYFDVARTVSLPLHKLPPLDCATPQGSPGAQ